MLTSSSFSLSSSSEAGANRAPVAGRLVAEGGLVGGGKRENTSEKNSGRIVFTAKGNRSTHTSEKGRNCTCVSQDAINSLLSSEWLAGFFFVYVVEPIRRSASLLKQKLKKEFFKMIGSYRQLSPATCPHSASGKVSIHEKEIPSKEIDSLSRSLRSTWQFLFPRCEDVLCPDIIHSH